ncbi:undecaprenyldiphospho-muramoylpentapeptide beta-N-acetylglucosaminyltransferase [bacterium]|nr:MAG: undecaprenyldiphospho-muramoylpentapeptide beta-N-acetylglucosaminyltransferase [bacterium]
MNIAYGLEKFDPQAKFLFVGTHKGMEEEIISKKGYRLSFIEAKPWENIKSSLKHLKYSVKQVREIIQKFQPDCAIGTGGYVSAPLALASFRMGIPLFWQEQNAYPGLATRLASIFAKRIFLGFEECRQHLWRKGKTIHSGNPVIIHHAEISRDSARRKFSLATDKFTIFLTGGSQGAAVLNDTLLRMIQQNNIPRNSQIIWQCGHCEFEALEKIVASMNINISLHSFIEDMSSAYKASDLVICRAGALTLTEISVVGIPAIIIPYPHSANEHQKKNALVFVRNNAAIMIDQSDLAPTLLRATINEIMEDPDRLHKMSAAMKSMAMPNAIDKIAKKIIYELKN